MEGRVATEYASVGMMSAPSPFTEILQRGMAVLSASSGSPTLSPAIHAPAPMRPVAATAVAADTGSNASDKTQLTSLPGRNSGFGLHVVNMGMSGADYTEPVKRKRGRPRKYGHDGSMALNLGHHQPSISRLACSLQKRVRGRPRGSGKKQQLVVLGRWLAGTAGISFTPHVIMIAAGEDVGMKIMSFSQQGPRAMCILSANGAISNVTLGQPATFGGMVAYEGRFEILSLSGSFLPTENSFMNSRTGGLSVSLAGPDGQVFGGVAGLLVAASPVQVIIGSFVTEGKKSRTEGAISILRPYSKDAVVVKSESVAITSNNSAQLPEDCSIR